jgi:hypothetical protein
MHLGINVDDIQKMVEIFKYADIGISNNVIAGLNGLSKNEYDQAQIRSTSTYHTDHCLIDETFKRKFFTIIDLI